MKYFKFVDSITQGPVYKNRKKFLIQTSLKHWPRQVSPKGPFFLAVPREGGSSWVRYEPSSQSNQSHSGDNTRVLSHWVMRELWQIYFKLTTNFPTMKVCLMWSSIQTEPWNATFSSALKIVVFFSKALRISSGSLFSLAFLWAQPEPNPTPSGFSNF